VIFDDQVNVNPMIVAMAYADVYRGAPYQAYCLELEQAEAKARQERVGMWAATPPVGGTEVGDLAPLPRVNVR